MPIILGPVTAGANEALVLNGVAINDASTYMLTSLSMPPPPKRAEWISGADNDGALLGQDPRHENRVIEARIAIMPQVSMDLALAKIAALVDQFEECERNPRGLALTWVPANSTLAAVTFRCLSGEITDLPIDITTGWFVNSPEITVRLTCLPFWEKAEVSAGTVTSGAPIITLEVTGVGGDVPALGRLVVADAATQNRRYVEWGLESRYYPTASPPSLIVDSAGMVTTGFAGVTATRTAAYSAATNNVISATLRTQLQAVCGLGNLSHVGVFRPQLRFYASATTIALRLTYQSLDGPLRSLSYKIPVAVGFNHVDLGLITIPQVTLGTQRWTGRIEAYSTATGGETFQVDAMWLMPAELFGRSRATYRYAPGPLVAYDDFTATTAGVTLNARAAPTGGTWATSGSATDLVFSDGPSTGNETVIRQTTGDASYRFAILGATSYTDTETGVDIRSTPSPARPRLIARWTDANNYLFAQADFDSVTNSLIVGVVVAGVTTNLSVRAWPRSYDAWWQLRLVALASGRAIASIMQNGVAVTQCDAASSVLATAGALATGKPGFADLNIGGASTRYYDNFYAATPAAEPIVCYSGRSIQFRDDATLRDDAAGVYAGPPQEYVGARFTIPCAGGPARKARVAVIARRQDVESTNDDDLVTNATTDSTTLTVFKIERGLAVPR